ncbi:MAG: exodeoxyribonuclease V subunit alpha [Xanthomonadaceae bacterium]|nr:exodeoxyribonuclease V subunit alpha [Xanthomonadaceae bacterium]
MIPAGRRFDFRAPATLQSDEGLRPVDLAVARWVIAHGGGAPLADVAARASLAEGRGDSAYRIEDAALRDALAAMPLVGNAISNDTPFVLDGELFYLRRNFAHEVAVAGMLQSRLRQDDSAQDGNDIDLQGLFDENADAAQSGQVAAVRKALGHPIFVLTGGPGTGKTTTVLRLLMATSRRHHATHGDWPRILLAAPTGKAAQRLGESLRHASPDDFPSHWHEALDHVQAGTTGTLHRMLGSRGTRGGFRHNQDMPLDPDIVVIDEASMLDLSLLRALLAAMRPDAALLLVGDADQLDSVGTGSVLQDIVAALDDEGRHLQRLQHAYRADAALRPLNEAVRKGDAAAFHAALTEAGEQVRQIPLRDARALALQVEAWSDALLADYREHQFDRPVDDDDAAGIARRLAVAGRRQLLCALREGAFGAAGLNAAIEARLGPALQAEGASDGQWYPGRRILVIRNDPASGLFNGDIGLCLLVNEGQLRVWFPGNDGYPRSFDISALPPHEPAFAMTVHKAQGSEYDEVIVLPPPRADHPLLSRQWFYTAMSRARRQLHLWSDDDAITQAIEHPARRSSGLARRIRKAASA